MNNTLTLAAAVTDMKVQPAFMGGQQMLVTFQNGWGMSILNGQVRGLYTSEGTYEVAILTPTGDIDGDVYGYQTPEEVNKLALQTASRS